MQRNLGILILLLSVLLCACHDSPESTSAVNAGASGNLGVAEKPMPNADEMIKRIITQDGCKDFTADMRMTAESEGGKQDQVDFRLQRKYSADEVRTFLTVQAPREETSKALLAIERQEKPTEAFSYLAGLKKLARLDSSRVLGFRGAKVQVQELLGMELGNYSHDNGERATSDGESLIKINLTGKRDFALAYPRIILYFREANQQPVKFELFGNNGEIQKKVTIEEVKEIQGHQTITRVTIDDLSQKLQLKLETRKIEYDRGLPDKIFTEENLKSVITEASRKLDQGK